MICLIKGASTDSSLDISSLALKYLDDDQLNNLALKHQGESKKQVMCLLLTNISFETPGLIDDFLR